MFWASQRQTTRVEDESYSLMALFNITMPSLYGERSKAFQRLQREILKNSSDESFLAWTAHPEDYEGACHKPSVVNRGNVLAACPSDFWNSNDVERTPMNLARALVLNGNGIDIYRDSDHLCVFRRQVGPDAEQLLFIVQLGCEREIPGQLSDPCVIALLAEVKKRDDLLGSQDAGSAQDPVTVVRRVMSKTLSALGMESLTDLGWKSVHMPRERRYHLWLPFENISPGGGERLRRRRRRRSRL